jgi:hypothetical protein
LINAEKLLKVQYNVKAMPTGRAARAGRNGLERCESGVWWMILSDWMLANMMLVNIR